MQLAEWGGYLKGGHQRAGCDATRCGAILTPPVHDVRKHRKSMQNFLAESSGQDFFRSREGLRWVPEISNMADYRYFRNSNSRVLILPDKLLVMLDLSECSELHA